MTADDAIARLDSAQRSWTDALDAHWSAPPAPGYDERLLQLANAAEEQASAFRFADREGLAWRPLPNASTSLQPPPELRPDFNRTGPPELWARFDETVRELGLALEGVSSVRIAQVFDKLSESLRELSSANRPRGVAAPTARGLAGATAADTRRCGLAIVRNPHGGLSRRTAAGPTSGLSMPPVVGHGRMPQPPAGSFATSALR